MGELYPIPENWQWVRLEDICTGVQYGYTAKAVFNGAFPKMLRITDIRDDGVNWDTVPNCVIDEAEYETYRLVSNDIVFARTGATTGKSYLIEDPPRAVFASYLIRIRLKNICGAKYIYHFLQSDIYWRQITELSSGIAQPGINSKKLRALTLPFPPLAEQGRIVSRIESLFSKLDEAAENLQAVIDGYEFRRTAVFHKAFSGELTAEWRKAHGLSLESWEMKPLREVAFLQTGLMKGKRCEGETALLPYLRVANVQDGFLDLSEVKKIEVSTASISRYSLQKGDVLFTEGGDFDKLGRGTVWEGEIPGCLHQNHIFAARPMKAVLNPYFLSYQAGSGYGKAYFIKCAKQTTNLASINSTQLKEFPVKLPSLEEQAEIVSVIDRLFMAENQSKAAAQAALSQIALMKKSILARAFRGELGTNDPAEECAT